ncbi:hypothetical protein RclHR1_00200044 [Rhizophagus clarus]|uniref:F-box domain-containing protein n=1 Tax=Rhizophagus clarus TaxID=94130 RepID=A0A2Z6R615_9GLOM|nr:hypothetical protein RclHR1_00200044 [Rhizophagus clarus]GES99461.1 hypothetical protein GLOIN_2v1767763 [Rhizophagus clarus]
MPTICFIIKVILKFYRSRTEKTNLNEKSQVKQQIVLPSECMQKIFKYTIQNSNKKTLFKLLFVNKYWSENVIPILWNNPFKDLIPPSMSRHTQSRDPTNCYNLLRTYLSCLDNDDYYLLFSKLNPSSHPFDMEIPNSFKPLYNYPNYLKELSYSDLENTIYTSFMINSKHHEFQKQEKYQVFLIASSLYKLFLQNSTQLRFLLFNNSLTTCDNNNLLDIPDIKRYNNITIKPALSNITKFQFKDIKIRTKNILLLLNSISIYSTKINHLEFKFDSEDYNNDLVQSISDIIKSQKQIFEFNISNLKGNYSESIFLSLYSHHKPTLFSLKLQNIHFTRLTLSILPNLINLKNLYLYNCNGFNNRGGINNDFRNFNLKKLQIFSENDNDDETRNLLLQLLKQSGSSLKQLGIDLVCNKENIDIILNYCPNIIVLFIMNNDLLEWKEKFNYHSKKVFIKNLNIKRRGIYI